MKLIFVVLLISLVANAQVSIDDLCSGSPKLDKLSKEPMVVVDKGFCEQYKKQRIEEKYLPGFEVLSNPINITSENCEKKDKWKLRFYASHSFTTYFDTDMKIQSTRYNVEIKDYQWAERSSREFFLPSTMFAEGNNPAQMIDEPTNTFVLSLEKDGHEFFLSAFHPKFLQDKDQVVEMSGTIDGHPVLPYQPLNTPFYGYTLTPGESKIVRNQNTHKEMIFELGYGHRLNLMDNRLGKVTYVPSVGAGVTVGENLTVVVKEGQWWEFDESLDNFGVQGFGGSVTNRLEYNTRNEKFGVFYENKLGFYKQKHAFLDGTQQYNLGFMGNSVGMKFMIYNPKNKKKVSKEAI